MLRLGKSTLILNLTMPWIHTLALNDNGWTCIFPDFPKKSEYQNLLYCSKTECTKLAEKTYIDRKKQSVFLNSITLTSKKSSFLILQCPFEETTLFCFVSNLLKLKVNFFYIFSTWTALWCIRLSHEYYDTYWFVWERDLPTSDPICLKLTNKWIYLYFKTGNVK